MQRAQHQVSRQRRFDGDLGRLEVPDLPHQDDIGVLAEEGTQGGRKVQSDLLLHLDLVDSVQLEFDGVLGRNNVRIRAVQARDGGVQGIGLSAPRRSRHQHHAPRFQDRPLEFVEGFLFEPELGHVEPEVFLVEQPHDHFLAMQGRQHADAEVQLLHLPVLLKPDHDAAVLREPFFRDIELGHNLHAGNDAVPHLEGRGHDGLQHAVNPVADAIFLFVGFHVNVAGSAVDRLPQDDIHQLHHRRIPRRLFEFSLREFFFGGIELEYFFSLLREFFHDFGERVALRLGVEPINRLADGTLRGHHRLHIEAGHEFDVVHGEDIGGVHHGDRQRRADPAQRHDFIAPGGVFRHELDHFRINFKERQINGRNAILAGEEGGYILVGYQSQLDQATAQPAPVFLLVFQRVDQLFGADELLFDHQVA